MKCTDVQVETLPIKFLRIIAAKLICSYTNWVPILMGKSSSKVHELGCFKLTSCYVATLQGTNISHHGKMKIIFKCALKADMGFQEGKFPIFDHLNVISTSSAPGKLDMEPSEFTPAKENHLPSTSILLVPC